MYSVIALSRQAFCSYTFFIFSQRKDGENVAECYKTIEYPDRKAIAALYAAGAKAGQIAKEIGVAPRTIYAELKRGREGDKLDKNFRPSEEKRKTTTSTAVKTRYNEKVYDVISARVPKELAAAFKEKCAADGIPQAQIIKKAIEEFLSQ